MLSRKGLIFTTECKEPRWVNWSKGQSVPANAVVGGSDCDGTPIYVGRFQHMQDLLPAKVIPLKNIAYVSYGGKEIGYTRCEILCCKNVSWVPAYSGNIPENAIPAGHTATGEKLYAARFYHNGSLAVGKLHPSHHTAYIPFGGEEISNPNYEVLVKHKPAPRWESWSRGQPIPANAVVGGNDCDGTTIYVGRFEHEGDLLPAKVMPSKSIAYVSYAGKEIGFIRCEILCYESPKWTSSTFGNVPSNAIPVGRTKTGENLYAARFRHNGALTVGKLHPSHRCAYIPFGGEEVSNSRYEVLIS